MATDNDNALEDQSDRHFLPQLRGNLTNESFRQIDDGAKDDINELYSEMGNPSWTFQSISRYMKDNNKQCNPITDYEFYKK